MKRFVGWLIGVLLLIGLLLTAVVGVARQDRTPGMLQRIGYMVCDGRPCFRGIGLGTGWQAAQTLLKGAARSTLPTELAVDIGAGNLATVNLATFDTKAIDSILTVHGSSGLTLDIRLGEVLLMYGTPCRIGRMIDVTSTDDHFVFVYPTMSVLVRSAVVQAQPPTPIVTFYPNSRIDELWIMANGLMGDCSTAPFGLWSGFASSPTYLRELLAPQPTHLP